VREGVIFVAVLAGLMFLAASQMDGPLENPDRLLCIAGGTLFLLMSGCLFMLTRRTPKE
jgi:hypothetical protein